MNKGQYVFSQLISFVPKYEFNKYADRYNGNYRTKDFKCWSQFLCMLFGQLTYRESISDIINCLSAHKNKVYHLGIKKLVAVSSLTRANQTRDWRIYQDFAHYLISLVRTLYKKDVDFKRLFEIKEALAFFVLRSKSNFSYKRLYSNKKDKTKGIKYDQIIKLTGYKSKKSYPEKMRKIKFYDKEKGKTYEFITNNFELEAIEIANLYKQRWQIELFFKWVKQHLKIKSFWGYTENAVKTQIWIAVCAYLLVAYAKKMLNIDKSIYEILQILSLSPFDKSPINELLTDTDIHNFKEQNYKRLNLFDL